jgi:hypothetical protein
MPEEFRDTIDANGGDPIIDAVDIGEAGKAGAAPEPARAAPGKRRGRPPGSRNASGASKEKTRHTLDLSSLTGLFVGIHVIAAGATNVPELAIDMKEGDDFMKAAQNVMRHYSVESSQKTIDWLAFGGTCCMIYGTRFGAYMLRKREERKEARPSATVYPLPQRTVAPEQSKRANAPQAQPAEQPFVSAEADFEQD